MSAGMDLGAEQLSRSDWVAALCSLGLPVDAPVAAHASLSAFGPTAGGAETLVDALLEVFPTVVMPVFTYTTMLTPEVGPAYNGMAYGLENSRNLRAQFFHRDLPADRLMGRVPEALRLRPQAQRSSHPILSFTGVHAQALLQAQTLEQPLAPLEALVDAGGWVLLLGVDHTANTSIHVGERRAGRQAFVRWALTPQGVVECPGFPGCSDGFQALAAQYAGEARRAHAGLGTILAFPLQELVGSVQAVLERDPLGLLCDRSYCERCYDARRRLEHNGWHLSDLSE